MLEMKTVIKIDAVGFDYSLFIFPHPHKKTAHMGVQPTG